MTLYVCWIQLKIQNIITNVLSRLQKNSVYVFQLPTVKPPAESNDEEGEPIYQNQKVQFSSREKRFTEDHIVEIVERVLSCFENRHGNLYSNLEKTSINIP